MLYKTLAFILGFTCFIVQLVLLREFMNLFMGNELVIGIMLSLWMLLTAAGAWLGLRIQRAGKISFSLFSFLLLTGLSPIAGAFLTVWLRSAMFAPGAMISLQGTLQLSLAGLLVFCLVSGMMFTLLAVAFSRESGRGGISRIYALEALGSLGGGLMFNFVLIYTLTSMQILVLVMGINMMAAALWAISRKKTALTAISLLLFILSILLGIYTDADRKLLTMVYPGQEILQFEDTPFGKMVAGRHGGQTDIFLGGQVLVSSDDIIRQEEKVHYAMCLHKNPRRVLMLLGGLDASPMEVMKYEPVRFDYVDPDPWAIEYAKDFSIASWPDDMNVVITDPHRFLQGSSVPYDVIMLNAPPPNTVGNNRYYTEGFFGEIDKCLAQDGIFALSLPGTGNYLDEYSRKLLSSLHLTLRKEFAHIRFIPGGKTYILASQHPLNGKITERISRLGINNEYVNRHYLFDDRIEERAKIIREQLDDDAVLNTNTRPVAAHLSLLRWLGMLHVPVWLVIIIPLILTVILMLKLSSYNLGLFATGFTASSGEFLLLIAFQSIYGFIYQMAGLIIMIFMAGLFLGSGYAYRLFRERKESFGGIQVLLGLIILLIPLLMKFSSAGWMPGALVGLLTFILAIFTGIQYRLATRLRTGSIEQIASSTYGDDLAGSAFGVFFVGVFLFPVLGVLYTVLIIGALNLMVASFLFLKKA